MPDPGWSTKRTVVRDRDVRSGRCAGDAKSVVRVRAVLRKSACAARKRTASGDFFLPPRKPPGAPRWHRRRPPARHARCDAVPIASKKSACFPHPFEMHPGPRRGEGRAARAEDFFVRVLTVKKSVIRFRPSRRCLPKRVSRINTTTRSTTRASARNLQTVEQARFPQRKAANPRSTARAAAPRGISRIRIDVRIAPTELPPAVTAAGFRTGRYPSVVH